MKVALCLSGELRRVNLFFPIICKSILEPYNPDVFISTWNMPVNMITSKGATARDPREISTIDHVCNLYHPVGVHYQLYSNGIKNNLRLIGNTPTDNLMAMAFNILKAGSLAENRAELTGQPYDVVIRHRFDFGVKTLELPKFDLDGINIPNEHGYAGYNDQLAFGSMEAMAIYHRWVSKIDHIENRYARETQLPTNQNDVPGAPWHPESALKRYLEGETAPIFLINNLDIRYPWCKPEEIEELYD